MPDLQRQMQTQLAQTGFPVISQTESVINESLHLASTGQTLWPMLDDHRIYEPHSSETESAPIAFRLLNLTETNCPPKVLFSPLLLPKPKTIPKFEFEMVYNASLLTWAENLGFI